MFAVLLLVTCICGGPAKAPQAHARYAELPLRNLSGDHDAGEAVTGRLRAALRARGAEFVEPGVVEALLQSHRIRYTDSLSVAEARMLEAETGAQHLIAGVMLEFVRGSKPRIAVGLRVLGADSGVREQSAVVSLRGEDSRAWLGLGAIEDADVLADTVVARLLEIFLPDGSVKPEPSHARRTPDAGDEEGPRRERLLGQNACRLAVMPFVNRSTRAEAGVQFGEILSNEWFHERGVEVVEASELRAAMVTEKIRYMHDLDLKALAAIARTAGVRYFALGSVESYGEEEQVVDARFPVVEATVRLLDAQTGLVVASAAVRTRGDDHRQPLGFGLVQDPIALAQQAARKLVRTLED